MNNVNIIMHMCNGSKFHQVLLFLCLNDKTQKPENTLLMYNETSKPISLILNNDVNDILTNVPWLRSSPVKPFCQSSHS